MERALTYITLDVQKIDSGVLIKAKRGDSARRLVVSLTSRGRPYIPGEGVTAVFYERKPDGNPCFNAADIDGCTVTYDFTGQTTNVVGLAACEIRLYDAGGQLLTSPRFEMLVDPTEYQEGDVPDSSPEYTALTQMVSKGTELIRDLSDVQAGLEPIRDAAIEAAEAAERSAAASEADANRAESAAQRADADAQAALRAAEEAGNVANNAATHAESAAGSAVQAEKSAQDANRSYAETEQIVAHAEDAREAAELAAREARAAADASGGYYIPDVNEIEDGVLLFSWEPSKEGMPVYPPVAFEVGGGGGAGYVASEEPPENTKAMWVKTSEPEEAVALGVTAKETTEGVDMYCTDELGTTKVSLRHGKDGAAGAQGPAGPQGPIGDDYVLTDEDVQEIAGTVLAALPTWTGGAY